MDKNRIITAKQIIEEQKARAQRTPQELKEGIEKIKGLYSDELIEYLEALLSFEINIVNDNTYDEERIEVLKRLKLFRRLVDYNIFEYAKKVLKETEEKIEIQERYFEYFPNFSAQYKTINDDIKTLFRTDFINEKKGSKISFTIYQLEENEEQRKKRIKELNKLYKLESQKLNPYSKMTTNNTPMDFLTNPYNIWEQKHEEQLQYYRLAIEELKTRKIINEEDQEELEISKKVYDVLKEAYGPFSEEQGILESLDTSIKECRLEKTTPYVNIYTMKRYY